MTAIRKYRSTRGFTLVEILIVVIILGILAAIVIPQFTNASTEARRSNLSSQLQTLRSQIELYKLQHKDVAPKLSTDGWDVFTKYTDIDGDVSDTKTATHIYGPYMNSAPVNPLAGTATGIEIGALADPPAVVANVAWLYNETTGKLAAQEKDSDGNLQLFAE